MHQRQIGGERWVVQILEVLLRKVHRLTRILTIAIIVSKTSDIFVLYPRPLLNSDTVYEMNAVHANEERFAKIAI